MSEWGGAEWGGAERGGAEPGGLFTGVFARAGRIEDADWLQAMLDTEAALARAAERAGLAEPGAGAAVTAAARAVHFDLAELGRQASLTGNPVPALVRALTAMLPPSAAAAVHHGATSQDIIDTAMMLLARKAADAVLASLADAAAAAADLADAHQGTAMLGRTLLQQAVPVTFGLVAACWLTGIDEATTRLAQVRRDRLAVQFGGAAGTLAPLGRDGPRVAALLAAELDLADPGLPWHTNRLRIVELAAALAGVCAASGKIARDVTLLAQPEIAELHEGDSRRPSERGGASANRSGPAVAGGSAPDIARGSRPAVAGGSGPDGVGGSGPGGAGGSGPGVAGGSGPDGADGSGPGGTRLRRGGSSAMPHKRNPVAAIAILGCTRQAPGLLATLAAAAEQEHQRAAGAWHAEWQPLSHLLDLTGSAAAWCADLLAGLEVDPAAMRANLAAAGGLPLAEHVTAVLAPKLGRLPAHDLVAAAAARATSTGQPFRDVLLAVGCPLTPTELDAALDPTSYLGAAAEFTTRALTTHRTPKPADLTRPPA